MESVELWRIWSLRNHRKSPPWCEGKLSGRAWSCKSNECSDGVREKGLEILNRFQSMHLC